MLHGSTPLLLCFTVPIGTTKEETMEETFVQGTVEFYKELAEMFLYDTEE